MVASFLLFVCAEQGFIWRMRLDCDIAQQER